MAWTENSAGGGAGGNGGGTGGGTGAGREARIAGLLRAGLQPERLEIRDESEKHRGHGGWREGGETHFDILVVATAFAGRSRVDRHRLVNALLVPEFASGLHALALTTLTPEEAARR